MGWWRRTAAHRGPDRHLTQTQKDGWEGIVAKRGDSLYLPGSRGKAWLKIKNILEKEVVMIGWPPGQGRRDGTAGSLLLAEPAAGDGWTYVGKAGSGLSERDLDERPAPRAAAAMPLDVYGDLFDADLDAVAVAMDQAVPAQVVPIPCPQIGQNTQH